MQDRNMQDQYSQGVFYHLIVEGEWGSSFLTALQHNVGYLVPYH